MKTRNKISPGTIGYRDAGTGHAGDIIAWFWGISNIWSDQVTFLSRNFRLYIPDLPGSGSSPRHWALKDPAPWKNLLKPCSKLQIQEHLRTFSLIGHSMGGYITLAFAEEYPERLNGFGLINSSSYADNEEKIAARKKGIEFVQSNGAVEFLEK